MPSRQLWQTATPKRTTAFALMQTPESLQQVFDADMRTISPAVAMVGEMLTIDDAEYMAEEQDIFALLSNAV